MFSDPIKNLKMLGLKENDIVVDLGAGTGFYSVAAGTLVSRGKVYAVELQKDFLDKYKQEIQRGQLISKLEQRMSREITAQNILLSLQAQM